MAENCKKIDREYCFTDESVNVYGYRCLTAGLLLDEVKKNPIGFKMHNCDNGVVVRWEDFRVDGDKVFAKPVVNLAHPDADRTVSEIENGFLNAASPGKIVVLEASINPDLMLEGQTKPTVTKWFPREISLVDIPGNFSALANLYDAEGNELDLADFVNPKPENMSKIIFAATMMTALNLVDNATQDDADKAFNDLVDKAGKVDQLTLDLADMTGKHTTLQAEVTALKSASVTTKVQDLIAKGKADKKLTNKLATTLGKQFAADPEGLQNLLDDMTAQTSVMEIIGDENLGDFAGKSYDDLYVSGDLENIQKKFPAYFEKIKNDKFKTQ